MINNKKDESLEEDVKFKDYNPDDVPEDDTEDYEDHILRSHEEFDLDDTETESLKPVLNEDVKDWNTQAEKDKFAKHCYMFGLEPEDQFEIFISEQGNEEQILGIIKPYSNEPCLVIKNLKTNVEWAWNQRIFHKLFGQWKKDRYAQYRSKEADYDEEERKANEPQFEPVNPPVNLYDYLKENSNGAWISFTFDLGDGHDNYCNGVNDFRDPELLKQYEVTEERCDYVSLDQGSSYTLKVRKIDNKNEGLNEETEEDAFFDKWRENLQDKYHISPLGDIGGTYYIHVAQRIDPSGHFCAGYREPTQEELNLCVKEAEALGQKAEIVDKDHIRIIYKTQVTTEDLEDKNNNFDPEFINGEDKPLEVIGKNKD